MRPIPVETAIVRLGCLVVAATLLVLLTAAGPVLAATRTLHGSILYRERIALPPDARVEVQLLDVSLADAPSKVIAQTSFRPRGQVPIAYRLRFDDNRLKPRRSYALRATISVDGKLWFTSTSRHAVEIGGPDRIDIPLQRVAGQDRERSARGPAGRWLAEDLRGGGVMDYLQTVLVIGADGSVGGSGGCNSIGGSAKISGDRIRFGQLVSTMMACTPAAMNQERKFLDALKDVRSWRIDGPRQKLILSDGRGRPVMLLTRM